MSENDFETLASALYAFRRWQRRHGIKVTLHIKDEEASARMKAAIRGDGYADVDAVLRAFADVLDVRPLIPAAS